MQLFFAEESKLLEHMKDIGKRIRQARELRGIKQIELERATGLAKGYCSKLEAGVHKPSWETMTKIARILKISLDQLNGDSCIVCGQRLKKEKPP